VHVDHQDDATSSQYPAGAPACRLSELPPGRCGHVLRVGGAPALRRRLLEMGLCNGVRVAVVRRAPLGDPIEFHLRGYNLSLREDLAQQVEVVPEQRDGD
jgi:ferrous iron transport protein A